MLTHGYKKKRGRDGCGTTHLENDLVDLHKCDGFSHTHPLPVAKSELYVAFHLLPALLIQLQQSLGPEKLCIWAKEFRRPQNSGEVEADGGAAGDVVAQYILASFWNHLGDETQQGRAHADRLVDDSLGLTLVLKGIHDRTSVWTRLHLQIG